MTTEGDTPAVLGREVRKIFRRDTGEIVTALDGISFQTKHGTLTALVGPDGAGKTTLLRLVAGLLRLDGGTLRVLDIDVTAEPQQIQKRIGYMPQKFGLYEDLSVRENLDLYADMHGISSEERRNHYPRLLQMTALENFQDRLAGKLSGGMKQKLGLACTLVRTPELLLLDEPTVGVDPLSRRELWDIILQLVREQSLTVLLSTAYLAEAERCGHVVVLHEGKVLAQGPPAEISELASGRTFLIDPPPGQAARVLQAQLLDQPDVVDAVPEGGRVRLVRAHEGDAGLNGSGRGVRGEPAGGSPPRNELLEHAKVVPTPVRFEDGFMVLFRQTSNSPTAGASMAIGSPVERRNGEKAIEVRDLVRQFGNFTAVDHISFEVHRGEIFGLLGPNGAGKTTTFRMLCGLLASTSGTLRVAGVDLRSARASARQRIGYVAQKFSLYPQLSVTENLEFFASAYSLRGKRKRERINWALEQFELQSLAKLPCGQLPGGYKQRLAMAAALLHEPEILFLDEPTSGADPLARRDFWKRITALAENGVTVIATTHFMEEAEYCDHIAILAAGRVLAEGTPAEVRGRAKAESGRAPTMEDAFIAIVGK